MFACPSAHFGLAPCIGLLQLDYLLVLLLALLARRVCLFFHLPVLFLRRVCLLVLQLTGSRAYKNKLFSMNLIHMNMSLKKKKKHEKSTKK